MEAFTLYLFKSVIWLSGFALVFFLFLRNERFFFLNRLYLVTGILASFFFPFISVSYIVVLPQIVNMSPASDIIVNSIKEPESYRISNLSLGLIALYVSGILFVTFILLRQSKTVFNIIKKADIIPHHPVKLVRTSQYSSSFSFFSYVFVNPSVTDIETKEIVNHELAHINQKHWFDLVLVELLCLLQWFNPLIWIYVRFIRQNHEYLADEVALQRTSDPAIYRAALLNQIVGSPVIILANSFNYSINKKRFNMMKNIVTSPYRKIKLLLILPVIAFVLYAFARPEYKYTYTDESTGNSVTLPSLLIKEIKGKVIQPDGKPLQGASIVIKGTSMGASSDSKGSFTLGNVQEDGVLVVSYVGYKTNVIKAVFTSEMIIRMEKDTVNLKSVGVPPPPPPPPPTPGSLNISGPGGKPLIIVNGTERDIEVNKIDPNTIESITVLKDQSAISLYGEKGKNGVIIVTLKPGVISSDIYTPGGTKKEETVVVGYGDNSSQSSGMKIGATSSLYGEKGNDGVVIVTRKSGASSSDLYTPVETKKGDTVVVGYGNYSSQSSGVRIRNTSGGSMSDALIVIDGVISEYSKLEELNPSDIESMSVLKNSPSTDKYGEKAKNGVIEITTKKNSPEKMAELSEVKVTGYGNVQNPDDKMYTIIEEMPLFPGGEKGIQSWIYNNIKVMKGAEEISEPVNVVFTVNSKGKVKDAQVLKKKYPVWEKEAVRVVSSMPDWKPGSQNGKPIDVILQLPIDFSIVNKK